MAHVGRSYTEDTVGKLFIEDGNKEVVLSPGGFIYSEKSITPIWGRFPF